MSKSTNGKVMRVVLTVDGESRGYDLLGAFAGASMNDWKALIAATGRGSRALQQGFDKLARVDSEFSAAAEMQMIDTLGDLVFLARRQDGDKGSYDELVGDLPYMQVLEGLMRATQAQVENDGAGVDPTPPLTVTVTDQGESNDEAPTDTATD